MSAIVVAFAGIIMAGAVAFAAPPQKPAPVPPAPVPAQVMSGKKVFIANAGEENVAVPIGPLLGGTPDRVYNEFYAAVQKLARYQLVSSPSDADLVFEIGFTINGGRGLPEIGHLRLSIRDPKSNVLLWSFVEYAEFALLKGHRDKNLDQAMNVIVGELRDLVAPPGATAAQTQ